MSCSMLKRCRLPALTFHSILNTSEVLCYKGIRCPWKGDQQHFLQLNCGISHHLLRFYQCVSFKKQISALRTILADPWCKLLGLLQSIMHSGKQWSFSRVLGRKVFYLVVAGFNYISVYNKQPSCVCTCVWLLLCFLHIFSQIFSECTFSRFVMEGIMYYSLCLLFYIFSALPRQQEHDFVFNFFISALLCPTDFEVLALLLSYSVPVEKTDATFSSKSALWLSFQFFRAAKIVLHIAIHSLSNFKPPQLQMEECKYWS